MTLALLTQPETYVSLLTLTAMEVVLGIDNVVFISDPGGQAAACPAANGTAAGTGAGSVAAVGVMLVCAGRIGDFVNRHPSMQILALSFLLLIGVMLVAEGMGQHIGKGYIYFAMAFSLGIELLNMRMRKTVAPVALHHRFARRTEPTSSA
jgi:predicted tellurium resistance membrane protein TerC